MKRQTRLSMAAPPLSRHPPREACGPRRGHLCRVRKEPIMPHLRHAPLALCLSVTLAAGCAAAGRGATPAPSAEVPPEIALPAGEQRVLRLDARGTQDYACRPNPDALGEFKWVL